MAARSTLKSTAPTKLRTAAPKKLVKDENLLRGYLPSELSRLMNLMNMQLLEVLRPFDVTSQQFRVMQVIKARAIANVSQIARDAVMEQPLVSRVIDQLEDRKLAKRAKSVDNARIVEVSLTSHGKAVYASITPHREAIVADALSVLSSSEKATLDDLLCRIFQHLSRPRVAMVPKARTS